MPENREALPRLSATESEAMLENMVHAGQALTVRWGHEPWPDSWAMLVAETLLEEVRKAHAAPVSNWQCGDCNCLNRDHEAFCYRCGAGQPESEDDLADDLEALDEAAKRVPPDVDVLAEMYREDRRDES